MYQWVARNLGAHRGSVNPWLHMLEEGAFRARLARGLVASGRGACGGVTLLNQQEALNGSGGAAGRTK